MGGPLPVHIGEVPGAQLPGEEHRGGQPAAHPLQLLPAQGPPPAGGGGEGEVLPPQLQGQDQPLRAVPIPRLLQAQLQRAPGQGGGDHHPAVGGGGGVPLRDIQGQSVAGKETVQPGAGGLQGGKAAVEVQHRPGQPPAPALPQQLLAQGARLPQSVIALVAHHHQGAPGRNGPLRPEEVGPRPQPVGQQGGGGPPAPQGWQLPGGEGEEEGVCHGTMPPCPNGSDVIYCQALTGPGVCSSLRAPAGI